jgi:transcriptional regulator with XRE-family HTH domain
MSVTGYGNIERGFTKDISILRLTKIAFVLKVNPLQLLISEDDNLIPKYLHDAVIEGYRLCNEQKEKEINYLKGLLDRSQFQYDK